MEAKFAQKILNVTILMSSKRKRTKLLIVQEYHGGGFGELKSLKR